MEVPQMQQHAHHPHQTVGAARMRPTLWEGSDDVGIAERIGQRIIYGSWITVITAATLALTYAIIKRIMK